MSEEQKPKETAESTEPSKSEKKGGMGMYLIAGLGTLVVAGAVAFALGGSSSNPGAESESGEVESAAVAEETGETVETGSESGLADEIEDLSFLNTDEIEKAAREAADELARQMTDKAGDEETSPGHSSSKSASSLSVRATEKMSREDSLSAMDWLAKEKARLTKLEKELNDRAKKLDAQEREVDKKLKQVDQAEASRLTALAKLYDGMKHDQVARMIVKLDDKTIVSILPRMKTANASKILGLLPPDRGARISQKMITLSSK